MHLGKKCITAKAAAAAAAAATAAATTTTTTTAAAATLPQQYCLPSGFPQLSLGQIKAAEGGSSSSSSSSSNNGRSSMRRPTGLAWKVAGRNVAGQNWTGLGVSLTLHISGMTIASSNGSSKNTHRCSSSSNWQLHYNVETSFTAPVP